MIIQSIILIAGLLLLVKGADWRVDGASVLTKKNKVSDLAIGLTIVAFGISAPELVVNSVASILGYPDIVFGKVIGYNNFNLFIILGIADLILVGLLSLVVGGKLVVDNAVAMAQSIGVSEKIIGLTIVAAGTSLPELATSVVASMKKNNDIAIDNIIGSNIFNIFLILGVSSIISPLPFKEAFNLDIYILIGGTMFLFIAMFTGKRKKLDRWETAILLIAYLGYTTYLVSMEL